MTGKRRHVSKDSFWIYIVLCSAPLTFAVLIGVLAPSFMAAFPIVFYLVSGAPLWIFFIACGVMTILYVLHITGLHVSKDLDGHGDAALRRRWIEYANSTDENYGQKPDKDPGQKLDEDIEDYWKRLRR
ncbi:MAG: hypothetical protein ABSF09_04810 [Candidatus Bathyarchaeia archaeon]